jgi:hypothetical protein
MAEVATYTVEPENLLIASTRKVVASSPNKVINATLFRRATMLLSECDDA